MYKYICWMNISNNMDLLRVILIPFKKSAWQMINRKTIDQEFRKQTSTLSSHLFCVCTGLNSIWNRLASDPPFPLLNTLTTTIMPEWRTIKWLVINWVTDILWHVFKDLVKNACSYLINHAVKCEHMAAFAWFFPSIIKSAKSKA